MTYDIPTMIALLRERVSDDNGMNNTDSEYRSDIAQAVSLFVNPEIELDISISDDSFVSDNSVDGLIFSLIMLKAEEIILSRKVDIDVDMAVSADTPSGRVSMRDRPTLRANLRIKEVSMNYDRLKNIYLYGIYKGIPYMIDYDAVLTDRETNASGN